MKNPKSMSIEELVDEINAEGEKKYLTKTGKPRTRTKKERDRYMAVYAEYKKKTKEYQEKQKEKYNKEAKKATGLKEGDRVEYAAISPFGVADVLTGIVVKYRGKTRVKLDLKFQGKKFTDVHKGWKKTK